MTLFWLAEMLRTDIPKFGEPIQNQTIAVGREAVFSCVVDNLQTYKVSVLLLSKNQRERISLYSPLLINEFRLGHS